MQHDTAPMEVTRPTANTGGGTICDEHGDDSALNPSAPSAGRPTDRARPPGKGDFSTLPWEMVTPEALEAEERAYNLDLIERTFGGRIGRPRRAPHERKWRLYIEDGHRCSRTRERLHCDKAHFYSDYNERTWAMREIQRKGPLSSERMKLGGALGPGGKEGDGEGEKKEEEEGEEEKEEEEEEEEGWEEEDGEEEARGAPHFCWWDMDKKIISPNEEVLEAVLDGIKDFRVIILRHPGPIWPSQPREGRRNERDGVEARRGVGDRLGEQEGDEYDSDSGEMVLDPKRSWLVRQATRIEGMRDLEVAPVLPEECMVQLPRLEYVAERLRSTAYGESLRCDEYASTLWHSVNVQVVLLRRFLQTRSFYIKDVAPWMRAEIDARSPLSRDEDGERAEEGDLGKRKRSSDGDEGLEGKRMYKRRKRTHRWEARMRVQEGRLRAEAKALTDTLRIRGVQIRKLESSLEKAKAQAKRAGAVPAPKAVGI